MPENVTDDVAKNAPSRGAWTASGTETETGAAAGLVAAPPPPPPKPGETPISGSPDPSGIIICGWLGGGGGGIGSGAGVAGALGVIGGATATALTGAEEIGVAIFAGAGAGGEESLSNAGKIAATWLAALALLAAEFAVAKMFRIWAAAALAAAAAFCAATITAFVTTLAV